MRCAWGSSTASCRSPNWTPRSPRSTAPTRGLVATRDAIHASSQATLAEQLDRERDLQRDLGYGDDYREGVAAFTAKRAPRFGS
jgi:enoyl-CoA hydratase/carnithine racemase